MQQISAKVQWHVVDFRPGVKARLGAAVTIALAWSGTAMAQHHHPAHEMPMPGTPATQTPAPASTQPTATTAPQDHERTVATTGAGAEPPSAPVTAPSPASQSQHSHDAMPDMKMGQGGYAMTTMPAAFGPYPMTREASGTAWQPDASPMQGVMRIAGDWTMMGQVMLNGVYDAQSGRRGGDMAFTSGMVMAMATGRVSARDTVAFRAMLSPDPFMGRRGYPLLLAAGETADGRAPLIDRQHPHDLFMELAGSYSRRVGRDASAFVYFGVVGEPAFGPGSFMHRLSIMDSPEAPITHHWFDSTHITFGVLTAGVTKAGVKLETSRFKGREPDQRRYDIERLRFDSTAVRASWNPTRTVSLQVSWARFRSPEQLTPDEDQERWSASAIYTKPIGDRGYFAVTAAWGRKAEIGPDGRRGPGLDAYVVEAALRPNDRWTAFVRAERIDTDALLPPPGEIHGPAVAVGKASIGAIRDFRLTRDIRFGVGGLVARSATPGELDPAYGGDRTSGMAFVRLRVG